jgi:glycosyltransferase involved in cell wall biosynthesis
LPGLNRRSPDGPPTTVPDLRSAGRVARGEESPLRVLYLIDSLGLGGAESLLVQLARVGPSLGMSIQVAALGGPRTGRTEMTGALSEAGADPVFLDVRRIARYIRTSGCDLMHAHLGDSITLGVPAARLAGKPVVCTFHSIPSQLPRREWAKERLSVLAASNSDACIFVSEAMRTAFARRHPRHHDRWMVVRNGVDLSSQGGIIRSLPPELGIPQGAEVTAMVAALRPGKGQVAAIQAWRKVVDRRPGAYLLIVGSGPEEEAIRAAIRCERLEDRVVLAGFREDVPALLRACSLVTLFSYGEALPTVLMEAAGAGLPAVATEVGGTSEIVESGVTGTLVAGGDIEGFASAVLHLLEDPTLRSRMGDAARERARAQFSVESWGARLCEVYRSAQARHGSQMR